VTGEYVADCTEWSLWTDGNGHMVVQSGHRLEYRRRDIQCTYYLLLNAMADLFVD